MSVYYIIIAFVFVLDTVIFWMLPALARPTLPFGVRIPLAHADEPAIVNERRQYRIRLLIAAILIVAASIGFALLTDQRLLLIFGNLPLALACWAIYYYSHRRVQALKETAGWFAGTHQVVMAGTEVRSMTAALSWPLLAVAIGLILLTAALGIWRYPDLPAQLNTHFDANGVANASAQKSVLSAFFPLIIQIILTALLGGLAALTGRMRQDIDVEEPLASARQQQQLMQAIGRGLLLIAVCIDLTLLLTALLIWGLLPSGGLTVVYLALPVLLGAVGFVVMVARVSRVPAVVGAEAGARPGSVNRDDDRFWVGGLIYVNREDPSLVVSKRFGLGITLNFGHPAAWALIGVFLLSVAGIVVLSIVARS